MELEKKTLKIRYDVAHKALLSLEDAIELMPVYEHAWLKEKGAEQELLSLAQREYRIHRDSVIKRFEFTFDTTWKYAKFFLEERFGVVQNSPKSVFRECFKNKLLNEKQAVQAIEMIDARNATSHMYREEIAEEIWHTIPSYAVLIKYMLKVMKVS